MTDTAIAPSRPASGPPEPDRSADQRKSIREYAALAVLLIGTAVAYFWNLGSNGWANSFYAAAVQSGAKSWKAFFFGSSDWGNSITVDKTPASLWPMEISVRLFGMHSWSMLLPQVLLGMGSVALIWASLRRIAGPAAGLLGGLALAVTPVAALMFRFDNPDAALVFLMLTAVWAMTRALADGRWRWLVLCGLLVGFGFLAKQLQVMLVLPALALTYLIAGPPKLGVRLLQLLAAAVSLLAGAGWWVLIAQLWPADSRPYFGGSEHNSTMELALGYNGLNRLGVGNDGMPGMPGPPPGGGNHHFGFGSDAGLPRLFSESIGGQVAWLIPAALVLFVVGLVLRGRAPRTDAQRSAVLLWGIWALVTGLVFSFMRGIFHQYYTVALAPAVAGTVALGAVLAWRERDKLWVRIALAITTALTTATAVVFLSRVPAFVPWLHWVILAVGLVATVALFVPNPRRLAVGSALAATLATLAAPVAYSIDTIGTPHTGPIVLAGPQSGNGFPGGPPTGGPGNQGGTGNQDGPGGSGNPNEPSGSGGQGSVGNPGGPGAHNGQDVPGDPSGPGAYGDEGMPGGRVAPGGPVLPDGSSVPGDQPIPAAPGTDGGQGGLAGTAGPDASGGPAVPGGAGDAAPQPGDAGKAADRSGGPRRGWSGGPDKALVAMIRDSGAGYTWAAATIGSMSQADLQLDSGQSVMPIGGFGGGDPSPTLEQFEKYVAQGRIHYFVTDTDGPGGGGPGRNKDSTASKITQWVKDHYGSTVVGDKLVYDLTSPRIAG
ncbi:glycosyltransferase family 39 protein [Nocardia sp. alder85J]|uniref:glycosyltransferase family 39 protein n=1 Tax=Nocardia sp. alder85J TaxID=2862949 RepID=UPI001CD7FBE2|nr:glycosyltransferase family 39 protein [Nocardia sp. alder85J]MCX4097414.1 glycosyltransferase family 39 protein [Nocardia sp. alder85J]